MPRYQRFTVEIPRVGRVELGVDQDGMICRAVALDARIGWRWEPRVKNPYASKADQPRARDYKNPRRRPLRHLADSSGLPEYMRREAVGEMDGTIPSSGFLRADVRRGIVGNEWEPSRGLGLGSTLDRFGGEDSHITGKPGAWAGIHQRRPRSRS